MSQAGGQQRAGSSSLSIKSLEATSVGSDWINYISLLLQRHPSHTGSIYHHTNDGVHIFFLCCYQPYAPIHTYIDREVYSKSGMSVHVCSFFSFFFCFFIGGIGYRG